jgi:hypothetical protein
MSSKFYRVWVSVRRIASKIAFGFIATFRSIFMFMYRHREEIELFLTMAFRLAVIWLLVMVEIMKILLNLASTNRRSYWSGRRSKW